MQVPGINWWFPLGLWFLGWCFLYLEWHHKAHGDKPRGHIQKKLSVILIGMVIVASVATAPIFLAGLGVYALMY